MNPLVTNLDSKVLLLRVCQHRYFYDQNEITNNIKDITNYLLVVATNPFENSIKGLILYDKNIRTSEIKILDEGYINLNLKQALQDYMDRVIYKLNHSSSSIEHSIKSHLYRVQRRR